MDRSDKFNREQVRFICEEMVRIKEMPNGSSIGHPTTRHPIRQAAAKELASKLGCREQTLYRIAQGQVAYARPWVAEWRQEKNGHAKALPFMHMRHEPITAEQRELVRKMGAEGRSYAQIARATGIPEGSLTRILRGVQARPAANGARKPKAAKRRSASKGHDLGDDFQAFIDAKEKEEAIALEEKHAREKEELVARQNARRQRVIEQVVELWTDPKNTDHVSH